MTGNSHSANAMVPAIRAHLRPVLDLSAIHVQSPATRMSSRVCSQRPVKSIDVVFVSRTYVNTLSARTKPMPSTFRTNVERAALGAFMAGVSSTRA